MRWIDSLGGVNSKAKTRELVRKACGGSQVQMERIENGFRQTRDTINAELDMNSSNIGRLGALLFSALIAGCSAERASNAPEEEQPDASATDYSLTAPVAPSSLDCEAACKRFIGCPEDANAPVQSCIERCANEELLCPVAACAFYYCRATAPDSDFTCDNRDNWSALNIEVVDPDCDLEICEVSGPCSESLNTYRTCYEPVQNPGRCAMGIWTGDPDLSCEDACRLFPVCPNDPDQDACVTGCETWMTFCPDEARTMLSCVLSLGAEGFVCTPEGTARPSGSQCAEEKAALDACLP